MNKPKNPNGRLQVGLTTTITGVPESVYIRLSDGGEHIQVELPIEHALHVRRMLQQAVDRATAVPKESLQ